jgi:hypothetical protein
LEPGPFDFPLIFSLLDVRHPPIPSLDQAQDVMIAVTIPAATTFTRKSSGFDSTKQSLLFLA